MVVGKLAELLVFGFMPLALGMIAFPEIAGADERTLQGTVTYRERIALPANAVVVVELADVSLADAPATIVARQKIVNPGQVPINFSLSYDNAAIRSKMTYALQARITVDDQLWFTNDARHTVDPQTPQPAALVLKSTR